MFQVPDDKQQGKVPNKIKGHWSIIKNTLHSAGSAGCVLSCRGVILWISDESLGLLDACQSISDSSEYDEARIASRSEFNAI